MRRANNKCKIVIKLNSVGINNFKILLLQIDSFAFLVCLQGAAEHNEMISIAFWWHRRCLGCQQSSYSPLLSHRDHSNKWRDSLSQKTLNQCAYIHKLSGWHLNVLICPIIKREFAQCFRILIGILSAVSPCHNSHIWTLCIKKRNGNTKNRRLKCTQLICK